MKYQCSGMDSPDGQEVRMTAQIGLGLGFGPVDGLMEYRPSVVATAEASETFLHIVGQR